jgi:hypothetical protein
MGVFYEMYGDVTVRDTPEVREIIERFHTNSGEIGVQIDDIGYVDEQGNPLLKLYFNGGDYMSYTSAGELDDIAKELGQFVTGKPGVIRYEYDGEKGKFLIGSGQNEEEGESEEALDEIESLIDSLNDRDRLKLIEMLK